MKVRRILELSVDLADPVRETQLAIRAVLETLRTTEDQVKMLQTIKDDIDVFLKGAELREQPVREPSRVQENQ
ncbi:hypothetical protein ACTHSJ_19060 [Paenibacillus cellulositrophicus]|uniref:hypothetical protein n=1 Tax=Paenibacillus cellulositrophicus TaxID=562959 RepID=UPI003F807E09